MRRSAARAGRVLAPLGAVGAVALLDRLLAARSWSVPVDAALDWPAHLLTAWVVLAAAGLRRGRALGWALAGSVLIDLDHVPLYLGGLGVPPGAGRPLTHSLATVGVLLVAAVAWRARRGALAALATGVALHLLRDLARNPGIPLLWPLPPGSVRIPYGAYLAVLLVAGGVAGVRAARGRGRRAARSTGFSPDDSSLPSSDAPEGRRRSGRRTTA